MNDVFIYHKRGTKAQRCIACAAGLSTKPFVRLHSLGRNHWGSPVTANICIDCVKKVKEGLDDAAK